MANFLKGAIKKAAGVCGYEITSKKVREGFGFEREFEDIYQKCKPYTMTSKKSMYEVYKAVNYILSAGIQGDFVECGVWKGGNTMLIAYTLLQSGKSDKKIYLYDTFAGLPEPTQDDYQRINNALAKDRWKKQQKKNHNDWCFASIEEVKENMEKTGYPQGKLVFVQGKVEDTVPKIMPETISLLRLDTDWYGSTKHELIYLFPKLQMHGVLILDDYGFWSGARKASDEYFNERKISQLLVETSGGPYMGIKVSKE